MSEPKIALKCSVEEFALVWAKDTAKKVRLLRGMTAKQHERIVAGFVDGMAGRTIPHPTMGDEVPGVLPAYDPDYERAYRVGEDFANAASVFADKEGAE